MMMCSDYGNYRASTFADIFPDADKFFSEYTQSILFTADTSDENKIPSNYMRILWGLLYARYGNSSIASSDPNRFKYQLWSIIYSAGPAWVKKLELQAKLRNLTDEELVTGSKTISNLAYHDGTAPSTATLDEIQAISQQNTVNTKRSKLDGYNLLYSLLVQDVTDEFLRRFKKLFLQVVAPEGPLWYKESDIYE